MPREAALVIRERRANRHQVRRPLCPESDRQPFHGHMPLWANRRRLNTLAAHIPMPLLFAVAFLSPTLSFAQLNVITSIGFEAAYNELVPVFQKSSGITVSTKHSPSASSWKIPTGFCCRANSCVCAYRRGQGPLSWYRTQRLVAIRADGTC